MIDRENLAEAVYASVIHGAKQEGYNDGRIMGFTDGRTAGLAAGRNEGLAAGRSEGRLEGFLATARNMLKAGFDIHTIAEYTNLPESEIRQLA